MPLPFLQNILFNGPPEWMPDALTLFTVVAVAGTLYGIKVYSSGAPNPVEKDMYGKVVIITGGTSGIGAATAYALAQKGAQIVLLTRLPASNPFLADFVGEMRTKTGNDMIYAEQVDLSSLHSIRAFATRWIDNVPPRRLDMVILCASTLTPPGKTRTETAEGIEETWMVNYLANFHLLGILSPALRAQPFDRDVRIIIPTCSAYIGSPFLGEEMDEEKWTPGKAYARSKLALMVFGQAYQKHLDAYKRPDQLPMNSRVIFVDPGLARTPGMRRWLSRGTVWGLVIYTATYFLSWLFLKSAEMGAQCILYATMESSLGRGPGGKLVKECMEVDLARTDIKDEEVAKKLWETSDKLIEKTETEQAALRLLEKKHQQMEEEDKKNAEKAKELESLVGAIKKGQEAEKTKSRRKGKKAA
jgi:NAD(P)-dependent dehydrogenase (short-subunit alcohol dehydrogenase family)